MLNKTETTMLTSDAAIKKGTSDKTSMAQLKTDNYTTEANATPVDTDSFDTVPVIEHYNNYTIAGTHSHTTLCSIQTETAYVSQMKDDMLLPWWLVMMLRKANPCSWWIKQMLEEAGLELSDTDKVSAAEELLESFEGICGS